MKSTSFAATLVLGAMLSLPGCRAVAPRNLILISIDTLRADHLGCYGYKRPTSPAIDEMASQGVVFDDASATSPWTLPSHASLLTGLYPRRHGAISPESALGEDVVNLATWLTQYDFRTSAVVNSTWLEGRGLRRDFEDFVYVPEQAEARRPSRVTDLALLRLRHFDRERPFFLFIHYYDVHSDYGALSSYEEMFVGDYDGHATGSTSQLLAFQRGEIALGKDDVGHLRDLYDAGIRQLDDQLARLFDYLRSSRLLGQTLLVITSDHGEEFFERGGVLHGRTQYQEVTRVPLIFAGAQIPTGVRVSMPASLVDVIPTSLSHLRLPIPPELDGIDLQSSWSKSRAEPTRRLLFLDANQRGAARGRFTVGSRSAVRWGRFKLMYDRETQNSLLFDLEIDPDERLDVSAEHPLVSAQLLDRLKGFLMNEPAESRSQPLTAEQRRRLESLGYLQ